MELNLAYDLTAWTGFFTGASAAAGVLLGLMLTAVTVAQTRIEHGRDLAVQAYVLLAALFDALAVSLWPLAPFPAGGHRFASGLVRRRCLAELCYLSLCPIVAARKW
jgi:hypothetical protein